MVDMMDAEGVLTVGGRTRRIGLVLLISTFSATLPYAQRLRPERPWVAMITRSTLFLAA